MKKILLASPVRGGCSITYIKTIIMLHFSKVNKIMGGPDAPYDFRWGATTGTAVNLARDELARLARKGGFDGILWFDVDLGHAEDQMMLDMVMRLLSHDVDGIVAGQYVGHKFISAWHGAVAEGSTGQDANGLIEMGQIPIGFSYMPVAALEKIAAANPWRQYLFKETVTQRHEIMHEFFPIGISGPCSDAGKMERLRKLVARKPTVASMDIMDEIAGIVWDDRYDTNIGLGEDYYFCKMARDAGVKLYIDNNLIVPHSSNVRLPVNNQDMLAELSQEWRLHNDAQPEQVRKLIEELRPLLSGDIP